MADGTSPETTHDLLLALAGRVDDDLLGWARELTAVGEDAHAVELLTASLVASRTALPRPVRAALTAAARSARTDLDPSALLGGPAEEGTGHRFAEATGDDPVAGALLDLPARPLAGCRLLLTRRLTPAGAAPGPLPHPVVLVQVRRDGRPTDVLAYQVTVALERAGVRASVEVLTDGAGLSAYHEAALRSAVPVRTEAGDGSATERLPSRPTPRPAPAAEPEPRTGVDARTERFTARRHVPDTAGPLGQPLRVGEPFDQRPTPQPEPVADEDRYEVDARPAEEEPEEAGHRDVEPAGHEHGSDERRSDVHGAADVFADHPADDPADDVDDPAATTSTLPATPGRGVPHAVVVSLFDEGPPRRPQASTQPQPIQPQPPAQPAARPVPVREDPSPRPVPRPTPVPSPTGRPHRTAVTPISRTAVPSPIPLVRRGGPTPVSRSPEPEAEHPVADDRAEELPVEALVEAPEPEQTPEAEPVREPERAETPAFDALSDPLNGPLLAPLLDPTFLEDDPLGVAGRLPRDVERDHTDRDDARPAPTPERDPEPQPEEDPDAEWSAEWLSGTWAMAPSAFDSGRRDRGRDADVPAEPEPGADRPVADASSVETEPPSPRPTPRRAARHRYLDDPEVVAPADGPAPRDEESRPDERPADEDDQHDEHPDEPYPKDEGYPDDEAHPDDDFGYGDHPRRSHQEEQQVDEPEPEPEKPAAAVEPAALGLRPESMARLSDADRQLLARLQAELLDGRNPRFGGHAGVTNGSPRNGASPGGGRTDPPDLDD